jgi:hypothetical protein
MRPQHCRCGINAPVRPILTSSGAKQGYLITLHAPPGYQSKHRILRHLGLWQEGVRVHSGTDPPGETALDPWLDDPFPDYDTEPIMALSAT